VEPNIHLDDEVAIKINLEVSNVVKEIVSKSGTQAYQIGTRSAATVLRLKDGETQVLAGLISDEDRSNASKVPGIGELPVMSRLFGSQKDDSSRSEIVLSITPRVLRSLRRPELSAAEFNSGTETDIGGRSQLAGSYSAGDNDVSPPADVSPAAAPAPFAPPAASAFGMTGGATAPAGKPAATGTPPYVPKKAQ